MSIPRAALRARKKIKVKGKEVRILETKSEGGQNHVVHSRGSGRRQKLVLRVCQKDRQVAGRNRSISVWFQPSLWIGSLQSFVDRKMSEGVRG